MAQPHYPSPLEMLYRWEQQRPNAIFLRQPIDGEWHTWTWKEAAGEIRRMAAALKAMRLPLHSHVGLISKNCAHWILCDLAIMMAGHVSVPLYPNLTAASIRQILEHCDAPLLFVGKLDNWDQMKEGVPAGMQCISFPHYGPKGYMAWDKLLRQHEPLQGDLLRDPGEPGTLIYTSGSTGTPKGVMHKIFNFSYASHRGISYLGLTPKDRFFSYLPLAHIGERLFVEMGALYSGGEVWFAESIDKFQDNIRTAAPTVFLGVHRIWKKFQEGILSRLSEPKLNLLLKIPLISGILRNKIKKGLGLHEAKTVFTSAAPTPVDLILWFRKIGIDIGEGYAMTENFAYSHASLMHEARPGYVGHPLPGVEVRFGDDGEIQVKHPALMDGYYKDPELTRETLTEDGFLRTGDKGEADADGYLKITGRTKEIFKTSKGKYVVPNTIEMKVGSHQDIEMSCVTGTSLPQPIILVTLSETGRKKDQGQMAREIAEHIQRINAELDAHEKIQKVVILDENWTIDNNMLTPTMKLKRRKVEEKYASRFIEWYDQEPFVLKS